MNTQKAAKEYRLAKWSQILHKRKESGQSIKAFCADNGIHANVYYYWQRQLREAACEHLSKHPPSQNQENMSVPGFSEVRLMTAHLPEVSHSSQIRIETSGILITADAAYPPEKLAILLRELTKL